MANYYNLVGWKHTGFNFFNRPSSRDVLNLEYFLSKENYFQMKGVTVKRDDTQGLSYIDLQGSVKDERGEQVSPPNTTGVIGPGGPWYSLEEIDYIRLTRTGYPGDEDFVDISGHQTDPWNSPREGKLYVAYYFVTGLKPVSRNVTRVFLLLDDWTTMGGISELEIETGFKIRGHITEAEDAAGYNLAPETIGLLEPLEVKSHGYVNDVPALDGSNDIIVSSIDLTQYSEETSVDAFVAQAANGQSVVFPALSSVSQDTQIQCNVPIENGSTKTGSVHVRDYGFFDSNNVRVKHNLSILYSAGQLELQDSYSIPYQYGLLEAHDGRFTTLANQTYQEPSPVQKDISGYPRKADYLFGEEVLFSCATGDMNVQPFYDLSDDTILVWATLTPGGSPVARFKKIRSHPYEYDQTVSGMTWIKKAVVMEGASGSMWNQINNAFAQQTQNRAAAENAARNQIQTERFVAQGAQLAINTGIAAGQAASSGVSTTNLFSGGKETWEAAQKASDTLFQAANMAIDVQADLKSRKFAEQSLQQAQNQLNAGIAQQNFKAPYTNFVPDLNSAVFQPNAFGVYVVNTSAKDRQRLKNYFLRYGYNGLYKPLTWDEINVKSRVNYVQCEAVSLKHLYYPMRMTMATAALLEQGLFLWNERPNQAAFSNNPDRT